MNIHPRSAQSPPLASAGWLAGGILRPSLAVGFREWRESRRWVDHRQCLSGWTGPPDGRPPGRHGGRGAGGGKQPGQARPGARSGSIPRDAHARREQGGGEARRSPSRRLPRRRPPSSSAEANAPAGPKSHSEKARHRSERMTRSGRWQPRAAVARPGAGPRPGGLRHGQPPRSAPSASAVDVGQGGGRGGASQGGVRRRPAEGSRVAVRIHAPSPPRWPAGWDGAMWRPANR